MEQICGYVYSRNSINFKIGDVCQSLCCKGNTRCQNHKREILQYQRRYYRKQKNNSDGQASKL